MSYHTRFLWTRIHRPAVQTFILILLCLISVFNLFIICSGSLSHTPNIEIASISTHTSPEIESVDLDHTSEINNSDPTERTKIIYEENETTKTLQPASSESTAKIQDYSTDSAKSSKETAHMLKTEKNVVNKIEESKLKVKGLDKDAELYVLMKEQDAKRGVHNIDTELDLTTVENVKEQQKGTAKVRSSTSSSLQRDSPNEDYTDENFEEGAEEIETIILNSDKDGIRQLPFCKETTGTEEDGSSRNLTLAKKAGFFDGKQLVVATLDGRISFLDQTGQLHWSFCTGSFFSSSMSSLQVTENGKLVRFIPSLSGGLYRFDGENLRAMPATADSLLRKSFKMASSVLTGGRELKTFGLDLKSGNLKYECGLDGCKSPEDAKVESSAEDANEEDKVVLVVKKNLQTVRGVEPLSGQERWNFSVGTVELALAGITEGCYQGATVPIEGTDHNHTALTKLFRMAIPEGMVFGADEANKVVWQHKFESPISQAWVFENGRLTVIDPMKCTPLMDEAPSLYIGSHKQQYYVQESQATTNKIRAAYELTDLNLEDQTIFEMKRIEWKPTLTVALRDENTALSPIYDQPFFVYEREEVNHSAIEHDNGSSKPEDACKTEEPEDSPLIESGFILIIATLLFYWKEVLGISLLTALILLVPVVRIVRNRKTRQLLGYLYRRLTEMHILYQEQQQEQTRALVLYRDRNASETMSNSTLLTSLNSSTTFDRTTRSRTRTGSSSSNHSYAEDQLTPFVSQYIKEFEPIQCLGRGGFGVVFEARKKIDDRCYAVKRIPLPNRAKSRDRVMREVKALAKLDHKNIVRYFNAWIENPPVGWLEKNDPLWNQCIVSSPSPTTEYPSEMGNEDSSLLSGVNNELRKDYYEISVPGFTPDKENVENNDDSFIVFAASEDEQSNDGEQAPASASGKNKSLVEVINIPNHHSSEKNIDERKEGLWKLGDSNDSSIYNGSVEHSKFFVRPTTLDIPSSSNKSLHSNSTDNDSGESPLGIMYLYIQQELCQKRTLQEWLMVEKDRDLRQVTKMFIQIVEAVEYIHANRLIHRDLKPSNIFLAGGNGNTSNSISDMDEAGVGDQTKEMTIKIGDFGLVTTSNVNKAVDENNCDPAAGDLKANTKLTGLVGTTLYMSYEQSQRKSYDHKVDIYSLGLILFEMIVPFATNMERYDLLSKVRELEIPQAFIKTYPDEYKLIRTMVSHNPTSRPEAAEIKYWLNQHLKALNSENNIVRTSSNWHRSKSAPSPDHQAAKILKAHSFI